MTARRRVGEDGRCGSPLTSACNMRQQSFEDLTAELSAGHIAPRPRRQPHEAVGPGRGKASISGARTGSGSVVKQKNSLGGSKRENGSKARPSPDDNDNGYFPQSRDLIPDESIEEEPDYEALLQTEFVHEFDQDAALEEAASAKQAATAAPDEDALVIAQPSRASPDDGELILLTPDEWQKANAAEEAATSSSSTNPHSESPISDDDDDLFGESDGSTDSSIEAGANKRKRDGDDDDDDRCRSATKKPHTKSTLALPLILSNSDGRAPLALPCMRRP